MKRLTTFALVVLCALGLALAQDQAQDAQQDAGQERAALRVVHLALDSGEVDIEVDGEMFIPALAANSTSGYIFLAPGEHEIAAIRAGAVQVDGVDAPAGGGDAADAPPAEGADGAPATAPADDAAAQDPATTPLFTQTVNLEPGSYSTVLIVSTLAQERDGEQAADGEQADEGEADGEQTAQDAQRPQELRSSLQAVRDARDALDQDDVEAAQNAIEAAVEELDAAEEQVEGDAATVVENSRTSLEEARQALQDDDVEAAQAALQEAADALQSVEAQADAAADGEVAAGGAAQAEDLQVVVLRDRIETLPGASQAMVRLVNVAHNGNLDLVGVLQARADEQDGDDPATTEEDAEQQDAEAAQDEEAADETATAGQAAPVQGDDVFTELANLSFGDAGEYQQVPAAAYHIQVQDQDQTVLLDLPDTALEPGVLYTFYVSNTADGNVLVTISVDAGVNRAQF